MKTFYLCIRKSNGIKTILKEFRNEEAARSMFREIENEEKFRDLEFSIFVSHGQFDEGREICLPLLISGEYFLPLRR